MGYRIEVTGLNEMIQYFDGLKRRTYRPEMDAKAVLAVMKARMAMKAGVPVTTGALKASQLDGQIEHRDSIEFSTSWGDGSPRAKRGAYWTQRNMANGSQHDWRDEGDAVLDEEMPDALKMPTPPKTPKR